MTQYKEDEIKSIPGQPLPAIIYDLGDGKKAMSAGTHPNSNYLPLLKEHNRELLRQGLLAPGVAITRILHDDWCSYLKDFRNPCDCEPVISQRGGSGHGKKKRPGQGRGAASLTPMITSLGDTTMTDCQPEKVRRILRGEANLSDLESDQQGESEALLNTLISQRNAAWRVLSEETGIPLEEIEEYLHENSPD